MPILAGRTGRREEESESAFVSMADLVVSFLFILLVLLAFFATQFKPSETVPRSEYRKLEQDADTLREDVARLSDRRRIAEQQLAETVPRSEYEKLERDADALRETATGLRERLRIAEQQLADTVPRSEYEKLEQDADALREDVARLSDQQRIAEQQLANTAPRGEHEKLERDADALRVTITGLRERLRIAEQQLAAPDPLADYLEGAAAARTALLDAVAGRIRELLPGIRVTVVTADGIIRFRGDDLFESAQWRILPDSPAGRMAHAVANALADTLPCYTVGPRAAFDAGCNSAFALIETIQIEGHTDNVPIGEWRLGRECMRDNLALSACRGAETLRAADGRRPELTQFLNLRGDPVLSFAGYGDRRPIDEDDTPEARAANRRIDVRFILQTPRNMREVVEIRERLTHHRPHLPAVDN